MFVHDTEQLERMHHTRSRGNRWTTAASLIIAVFGRPDLNLRSRWSDLYMFDTGPATGQLLLRATELGLMAHPIQGFDQTGVAKTPTSREKCRGSRRWSWARSPPTSAHFFLISRWRAN